MGFFDYCQSFFDLWLPPYCLLCPNILLNAEGPICKCCFATLYPTQHHIHQDNALTQRLSRTGYITHAMACYRFYKQGKVQQLIHHWKYKGKQNIGNYFGQYYGQKLKTLAAQYEWAGIIAVPLHPQKKRIRGYNQVTSFAKGLSLALSIPHWTGILHRIRMTKPQMSLAREERLSNVAPIFALGPAAKKAAGKSVLLVDDVVTSGATLERCASLLKAGNCSTICTATVAMAM